MNTFSILHTKITPAKHRKGYWLLGLLLVIVWLLPPATLPLPLRAQPELLLWATAHPTAMVNIIVQKVPRDASVEQQVAQWGGVVTKDLPMINAFAAALPAARIEQLARQSAVRWLSLDGPVLESGCKIDCNTSSTSSMLLPTVDTSHLRNVYNYAIRADQLWQAAPQLWGQGVTVAVVDSGIVGTHPDFGNRVIAKAKDYTWYPNSDGYGHGTMIAGLVAGDGSADKGYYIGIAPLANLVDVRVTAIGGASMESDVIKGLQWIYDNRNLYNIRVVNLSLNATQAQSYHTSPINAASEILWFNGIVVVASAGNRGAGAIYPPANDPFIITVGATDDLGTPTISDDLIPTFSAYGTTMDGVHKPDLVAPGRNLVGPLNSDQGWLAQEHPKNIADKFYFRMSGTSVAAPVVSGAIALLLQDEPQLTPDQVKYRLLATANKAWPGYSPDQAGAGYLDIYAAVQATTTESANTGTPVSHLLTTGPSGVLSASVNWSSVNWSSVNWSSVNWSSVNWSSVNWSSVNWSSDYWDDASQSKTIFVDATPIAPDEAEGSPVESQMHLLFLPVVTR